MSTPPWIRIYRDLRHKAKVQRLPDALFKTWINLLCSTDDDGALPEDLADLAFELRMRDGDLTKALDALVKARLFVKQGARFVAHDWNDHQKRSDVSTERVKRHREKQKALRGTGEATDETVSETPPDTEQNRSDADTDQSAGVGERFEGEGEETPGFKRFWDIFPHRPGASRPLALEAWWGVRWPKGRYAVPEDDLVGAAGEYAAHVAAADKRRGPGDPEPRCHAHNWLKERRFEGFLEAQNARKREEAERHQARLQRIPDGAWRKVAETFAAAHGWPLWDGATMRAKLSEEPGQALVMEFDRRDALDRCVEARLADKVSAAASPFQVVLRTRPRAQPAPLPDGRDPLEIPERLRRVAVVEPDVASEVAA